MSEPEPVHIEPVPDDGVGAIMVGLVLWAAAGAACLMRREQLAARGDEWWIWTCVAGFLLGLVGLAFVRRRSQGVPQPPDR